MIIKSINVAALVLIPFAIWLGCTGRVDWWVIAFIVSTHFSININLE